MGHRRWSQSGMLEYPLRVTIKSYLGYWLQPSIEPIVPSCGANPGSWDTLQCCGSLPVRSPVLILPEELKLSAGMYPAGGLVIGCGGLKDLVCNHMPNKLHQTGIGNQAGSGRIFGCIERTVFKNFWRRQTHFALVGSVWLVSWWLIVDGDVSSEILYQYYTRKGIKWS